MLRFYEVECEYFLSFAAAVDAARAAWAALPGATRAATVSVENREQDARPLGDRYHVVYGTPMAIDLEALDEDTLAEYGITCEADVVALDEKQRRKFIGDASFEGAVVEDNSVLDIRLPITESDARRKLKTALERHPEMQRYETGALSLRYSPSSDCYEASLEPHDGNADGATIYVAADDSRVYARDDSHNELFEE